MGSSESASGCEAFRWTADSGMIGLGYLLDGDLDSIARGITADGSIVVGESAITAFAEKIAKNLQKSQKKV